MGFLPHVEIEPGQWRFGFYKDGGKVLIPSSIDRSVAFGALQGIAERRVAIGDKAVLGSINVAFYKPIVDAIEAAVAASKESGDQTSPDIVENRKLLDRLCYGIELAASYGLFTDQPLAHHPSKNPTGFTR